jgi:protein-S-isoprenylcysteine O-methyltransferase Ste14
MEKLNFLGIGPKIGMVAIPFLAAAIALSVIYPQVFKFPSIPYVILLSAGIIFLAVGLVFYAFTVRHLLKGLKNTKLMTKGPYGMCKNPLYASMILLLLPGLALVMNSWLVLITSFLAYLMFKTQIKAEYQEMEKFFGEDWKAYHRETPELMPKLKRKKK